MDDIELNDLNHEWEENVEREEEETDFGGLDGDNEEDNLLDNLDGHHKEVNKKSNTKIVWQFIWSS